MIIDCHVHVKHGDAAASEYTADQIIAVMDEAGIDKSVVFAMKTTTRHSIQMAEEAIAQYPNRLIPFAYGLPSAERSVVDELREAISERGFQGIKMHKGEVTMADYVTDPILDLAGQLGVVCLIDFKGETEDLDRMAAAFPETNILAAHMGRYNCVDEKLHQAFIDLAGKYENVYLDISGVPLIWKIKDAIDQIGASKVVFGTDGPHPTLEKAGLYAKSEVDRLKAAGFSQDDLEMVLGGSLARLIKV
jgi:hypothetical protein